MTRYPVLIMFLNSHISLEALLRLKRLSVSTYIGTHDLSDFFDALSDKYHFFGRLCPLVVPFGNVLLIGEVIDYFKTMFGCGIGINDSFDQ